jgi:aromatic ring-opening dioxygenase catalytic subunit (LigB family)
LAKAGLSSQLDAQRGLDHGTFVPLAVIYPNAEIPLVQLSLQRDLDPALHIQLGQALSALREQGVLILGSGLSYHNLRSFGPAGKLASKSFDAWLQQVLAASPENRLAHLRAWSSAPSARLAHPREEHLLPLMVLAGAALQDAARCDYHEDDVFGGITVSSFRFG